MAQQLLCEFDCFATSLSPIARPIPGTVSPRLAL